MAPVPLTQLCWGMLQVEPLGSRPRQPLDGFVLSGGNVCLWGWKELHPEQ